MSVIARYEIKKTTRRMGAKQLVQGAFGLCMQLPFSIVFHTLTVKTEHSLCPSDHEQVSSVFSQRPPAVRLNFYFSPTSWASVLMRKKALPILAGSTLVRPHLTAFRLSTPTSDDNSRMTIRLTPSAHSSDGILHMSHGAVGLLFRDYLQGLTLSTSTEKTSS